MNFPATTMTMIASFDVHVARPHSLVCKFFAAIRAKFSKGERAAAHCARWGETPPTPNAATDADAREGKSSVLNVYAVCEKSAEDCCCMEWFISQVETRQIFFAGNWGGPHHCERCFCGRARVEIIGEPKQLPADYGPALTHGRSAAAAVAGHCVECVLSASACWAERRRRRAQYRRFRECV